MVQSLFTRYGVAIAIVLGGCGGVAPTGNGGLIDGDDDAPRDASAGDADPAIDAAAPVADAATPVPTPDAAPLPFSCDTYLADLQANNPQEYAKFQQYKAENRGFTAVTNTFTGLTGRTLGFSTGTIGAGLGTTLPGKLTDTQYMALSFVMPEPGTGGNTGKFTVNTLEAVGGAQWEGIIMTISPCAGDFRPRMPTATATDHYVKPACRLIYSRENTFVSGNVVESNSRCPTPVGSTMYLNIALRNLYELSPPEDYCPDGTACGTSINLSN